MLIRLLRYEKIRLGASMHRMKILKTGTFLEQDGKFLSDFLCNLDCINNLMDTKTKVFV